MSALDDAIAAHAAHPAGSGFDPLSDSLADQACPPTAAGPQLRAGWENEPIEVPIPWRLALVAFLIGLLGFGLGGCSSMRMPPGFEFEEAAAPRVLAACPPLADLKRTDRDALELRVAEVERWYAQCRAAATQGKPARAPLPGQVDPRLRP